MSWPPHITALQHCGALLRGDRCGWPPTQWLTRMLPLWACTCVWLENGLRCSLSSCRMRLLALLTLRQRLALPPPACECCCGLSSWTPSRRWIPLLLHSQKQLQVVVRALRLSLLVPVAAVARVAALHMPAAQQHHQHKQRRLPRLLVVGSSAELRVLLEQHPSSLCLNQSCSRLQPKPCWGAAARQAPGEEGESLQQQQQQPHCAAPTSWCWTWRLISH